MNGKVLSRKIFKDNVCVLLLNNTSFSYRHRPLVNSPTHIYIHKACRIQGISNHKMFKKVLWYEGHILEEHLKNENYDVWQNHKNWKQDENIIISTWIDILALRYLKSISNRLTKLWIESDTKKNHLQILWYLNISAEEIVDIFWLTLKWNIALLNAKPL